MANVYKAEVINGQIVVKPNVIKKGKNIKIQLPSIRVIHKLIKEKKKELKQLGKIENGKRDL